MSNTIITTDLAAKEAVAEFHTEGMFVNTIDRGWEPEFKQSGYQPGTSIRVRRPARFSVVQSSIATPENIVEDSLTMTVLPYNVSTLWTDLEKQLSLNPEKLAERVLRPMANALLAKVETVIAQAMAEGSILDSGNTAGTVPGSYRQLSDGMARLMEQRVNQASEIFGGYTYTAQSALLDNNKALPNPTTNISNQYISGKLKNLAGVNFFASPSIYRLANGTGVNSDASLSVILIAGTTQTMTSVGVSKTFLKGQAFTIVDVFEVDPQTKTTLAKNKVFRLAADATSSGGEALTVVLTEAVVLTGSTKNVSGAGAGGVAATWLNGGAAAATSYQNLIYSKDSTAGIFLPPIMPEIKGLASIKTMDGIPVKTEFWRDGGNHQEYLRMDILFAVKVLRGNWISTAWGE